MLSRASCGDTSAIGRTEDARLEKVEQILPSALRLCPTDFDLPSRLLFRWSSIFDPHKQLYGTVGVPDNDLAVLGFQDPDLEILAVQRCSGLLVRLIDKVVLVLGLVAPPAAAFGFYHVAALDLHDPCDAAAAANFRESVIAWHESLLASTEASCRYWRSL